MANDGEKLYILEGLKPDMYYVQVYTLSHETEFNYFVRVRGHEDRIQKSTVPGRAFKSEEELKTVVKRNIETALAGARRLIARLEAVEQIPLREVPAEQEKVSPQKIVLE
jgi:hypothetical protein